MQVFSFDEKVRVTCPKTFKGFRSGPWRALVGACRGTSLNCRKAGSVRAVTSAPVSNLKVIIWLLTFIVAFQDAWLPLPMVLR